MELIDISLPVSPHSIAWPCAPKTELSQRRSMEKGDTSNNSNLLMNCHTGTHIDAPLHFIHKGLSIEQIPLDALIGEVYCLDLSRQTEIDVSHLEKSWPEGGAKRILLKTRNSSVWQREPTEFFKDFCGLTEKPARWLLEKGVCLIGIDALSIQRFGDSPLVHQILLEANIVLLEGLNLSQVKEGRYELICLPLKLIGTEAAPARAILRSLS